MTTAKSVGLLKPTLSTSQKGLLLNTFLESTLIRETSKTSVPSPTFCRSPGQPAFIPPRASQLAVRPRAASAVGYNSYKRTNLSPIRFFGADSKDLPGGAGDSSQIAHQAQGAVGIWTTIILGVVITSTVIYTASSTPPEEKTVLLKESRLAERFNTLSESTSLAEPDTLKHWDNMAVATPPGRVGTLTSEQEEKLRELWIATLNVFGILDPDNEAGAASANGTNKAEGAASKKSKKKRLGVFSRKKSGKDADSTTSAASSALNSPHKGDSDDKYGQTKEFHEALASLTPETIRATFWSMVKMDHPDALLLRFLRARKWDVEKALVMLVSTMRWRSNDAHVDDDIMKNGEASAVQQAASSDPAKKKFGEDFLAQLRLGKSFLHGLDKEGRPMCFVRVRLHKQGEQSEESLERYTVFIIETARLILTPPVDTACIIFDMTGFSMANMDYAPVKFMIKCFEANYPESLGAVLVHKAPWIFQGIWKIIKGWLDPVVASKVHFTNNQEDLEEFVPKSHIIKELGGDEDWEYKYIEPVPGENNIMEDTAARDKLFAQRETIVKEYEEATISWLQGDDEDLASVKAKRNDLAKALRDNYWTTDPYLRARCYYDRAGMIRAGGEIEFYPKPENSTPNVAETSAADVD
ncbi:hypothetical protein F5884DRAFT_760934 [Xylogone sp. PMI_703]|nr:hypothetical protein F5884DRAFT_760934 [Xylogone sp. PMI_703]